MRVSVIIPTFRRAAKLEAAVRSLAAQSIDDFEVLVTVDGFDALAGEAASRAWSACDPSRLFVFEGDKLGPCAARNRAIDAARGDVMVFFNDDVVPDRDCVERHALAHERLGAERAIIVGDSPWKPRDPESLFSRMLSETSLVFFHHRMRDDLDPQRDWGFRHAWLLNLSAPASAVRDVGGLRVIQQTYGRDDDELAYRMTRELGMRVLFRPEARVVHDHPMTPSEYLARERELGAGAITFAEGAPACALEMFRRDVLSRESLDEAAAFVEANAAIAADLRAWFLTLDSLSPDALDPHASYEKHLPLKRWCWRAGYLEAARKAGLLEPQRA